MATSSMSSTLSLALRQQRSQLRNDKLVHDIERATAGFPHVSTKRLELLKRQYLDLVADQQKNTAAAVPSAAPISRHDSSSSNSSTHHSPPSSATPSDHGSPPSSDRKSSVSSTSKKLDVQHVLCSPSVNQNSLSTTHSSAALSSPADQLASPSNQCLLSASNSSSSNCSPRLQTSNHSPKLPHSSSLHQTPSPFHSPAISKQNLPVPLTNHTPSPPCELPITLAKHSKADENVSDHSSSHLLSLLEEDSSSISSVSLPFTPDAVEKSLANSSSVLMKVDKATQEIRVEENLEEKEKLNLLPPVSNGETNKDKTSLERNEQEQQLEDSKSVTEERKVSQKKDSSSVNESDSDDFWANGSIDDLPLPEENNEKQNKPKEDENEEREEALKEETEEAEGMEEETDEEEMEDVVIQDHISIVQHMLHSLNDRLRKDREEAKYLYMDGSPTDGMKGLIVSSKVLTAVLTRVSGEGCEISSWDIRAVAAVLREELREMVNSEGPLMSGEDHKKSLEIFNDSLKSPWREVWSLLVEHARLVFQCGQSLESVAASFSIVEEGERHVVLQNLLEASCGVEQSWSANSKHDDTISSSSSGQNCDNSEVHAVSESDAYRSLLLQSSLVLSGELSSDEADSDIEQRMHKMSASEPLSPVHHNLLVSNNQATFKTSAHPNKDVSIASSTSSSSAVSLPSSKPKIISTSDVAKRTTMMKRMGILDVSESESDIDLQQQGLNDTAEDFDFYS